MINLVKLMEGKNQFAGEEVGQKPGDQVRGTDQAEVDGKEHPFKGRLVGEDTTLEDVLSKKYQDFKDVQAKEKEEKRKEKIEGEEVDEAAPALVRGAAGLALGGLAASGTVPLMGIFGPILGMGIGAVGSYKAAQWGMQGADAIWDKVSGLFGGEKQAESFAMAHARAAVSRQPEFEFGGKVYKTSLKPEEAKPAVQAVKAVAESRRAMSGDQLDEISLGDYMTKAKKSRALSQMSAAFANDPAERERHAKKALTRSSGIDRAGTRVMAQQQARASKERAAAEQSLRDKYAGVDIDAEIERLKPAMQSAYQDYQYGARNTWRQGKEKYEQLLSQVKELTRAKELLSKGVTEAANPADKVTMDVPLMIRLFEYAREDAQTDMDLHDVSERLIELSGEGRVLTMQDYDAIVGQTTEQMVSELGADGSALGSVAAAKSQQAALSTKPDPVNPNGKAPAAPSAGAPAAKTTSPTTQPGEELIPDEQDALDKIKANAGLKSQYDRLLKQAQGGV
jgi:hypothetical protein